MRHVRIVFDEHERVGRWVYERTGGEWFPGAAKGIGLERSGELIAGVVYDGYNGASVCMHVASDGSRRWLNREFLRALFRYPFWQLGVKKIIGLVPSTNQVALDFDKHIGFVEEYRIEDAQPDGATVILSMTPAQCKWL